MHVHMHISRPLEAESHNLNFTPQMLGSIKRMIRQIAGRSLKYGVDNNIPTAELEYILNTVTCGGNFPCFF